MGNQVSSSEAGGMAGAGEASGLDPTPQEIETNIQELVAQERVVIFAKEDCPHCVKAKSVFDNMGQKYAYVDLTRHPQMGKVQDVLSDLTGARTVPRVFIDGRCIGGRTETETLLKEGKLEQILSQDGLVKTGQ